MMSEMNQQIPTLTINQGLGFRENRENRENSTLDQYHDLLELID